ncbi:hypothetical protein [Nocardioides guangzhouensis]|uniref:hypothetical protein n=1 Tax=Nocardioides guangzhouensis TaxID=2497878 RepID=UPI00143850E3|nr:hypothetical protein [Nocardioides guangzhouensis]
MSALTLTWTTLAVLFVLGAAPVFVVRLAARIYPKGHPRRAELVAEMQHVAGLRMALARWYWMSETVALAVWEGVAARLDQTVEGTPEIFTITTYGPATATISRGPDRLHFTFDRPASERVLDPSNQDDAMLIDRIKQQRKAGRRSRPFRSALAYYYLVRMTMVRTRPTRYRRVRVPRPDGRHRAHARTSTFRRRGPLPSGRP